MEIADPGADWEWIELLIEAMLSVGGFGFSPPGPYDWERRWVLLLLFGFEFPNAIETELLLLRAATAAAVAADIPPWCV